MKAIIETLSGSWNQGQKTLYTSWLPEKEHRSTCTLSWRPILNETALSLSYTWQHEGKNHQGEMLLMYNKEQDEYSAAWCDSWHQSLFPMQLKGKVEQGTINLLGTFPAGPGEPDWGWRICIFPVENDSFKLEMYVIPPVEKGSEEIAVRIEAS